MNRNRMLVGLGVAVLVALVVSNFVYRKFQQATAVRGEPMRKILVAAKGLPLGTRLDASMLRAVSWPASQPVTGMCTRVQDCTNRALITPGSENEPILQSKLAPAAAGAGLAAAIPPGNEGDVGRRKRRHRRCGVCDAWHHGGRDGDRSRSSRARWAEHHANDSRKCARACRRAEGAAGRAREAANGLRSSHCLSPQKTQQSSPWAATQGKIQLALRNTVDTDDSAPPAVLQTSLFASDGPLRARRDRCDQARCAPEGGCPSNSHRLPGGDYFRETSARRKALANNEGFRGELDVRRFQDARSEKDSGACGLGRFSPLDEF